MLSTSLNKKIPSFLYVIIISKPDVASLISESNYNEIKRKNRYFYPSCTTNNIEKIVLCLNAHHRCDIYKHEEGEQRKEGKKEGNVLFNDALNTFYLRLYGVRTTQIAREETRYRHYMSCSFRLAARVLLYTPFHRQDSTYNGVFFFILSFFLPFFLIIIIFLTPFVDHWLEREIVQWVHHEGSIRRPIAYALPRSCISLLDKGEEEN